MPAPRFFRLAVRLPYYAGAMQARVLAEQERGHGGPRYDSTPEVNEHGVDMRHNMAAAKAAAKGLKHDDGKVKYVPAEVFLAMPEVQGERVTV
jgi:hypothetical protein